MNSIGMLGESLQRQANSIKLSGVRSFGSRLENCDGITLVAKMKATGPPCHVGGRQSRRSNL
jgi:hypothetical protein